MALAAGAGALMAFAQSPVSWPVVLFVALPVLLRALDHAPDPRAAFGIGWAAGAGFFAAALFWIVEPFLVDPERHGWMAPFALIGLAGGLALFWAAPFALARRFWPPGPGRILILACLWTLSEFARAHLLTGFPWALVAYAWVETPVIQSAALLGPHLLGFLTLIAGLLPGLGSRAGVAAAVGMVAVAWGHGALREARAAPPRADPLVVRLVQPNAEQHLKWLPGMQEAFYRRHLDATRAPADPAPDITIWSETAAPFVLGYAEELQAEAAAAAGPDGRLILGIRRFEASAEREQWFNSLAILGQGGRPLAVYDKHHLVPFGEYIPFAAALSRLGLPALATLTQSGFAAGAGPRLLSAPGVPPFLPLICYEAIFPHGLSAPEGRPEWIVQVTNDAWFGQLTGPYQHLAQARIRAIEQGLPVARAANTGISAMIDARGRVVDSLPLGVAGHLDARLPGGLPPTLYALSGDLPGLMLILAVFGLTVSINFGGNFIKPRR